MKTEMDQHSGDTLLEEISNQDQSEPSSSSDADVKPQISHGKAL